MKREIHNASPTDDAPSNMTPYADASAGGRLRTPGVLENRESRVVFVDGAGTAHPVHGFSSWRQLHGEITGAPLTKHRVFWCGGTETAPTFYGSEQFGSQEASVLRYSVQATPQPEKPAPARRARMR